MVKHQYLIWETQSTIEGPVVIQPRKMQIVPPALEIIKEVTKLEAEERSEEPEREPELKPESKLETELELQVEDSEEDMLEEVLKPIPQVVALEGQVADELWQQVQELKAHKETSEKPAPLLEVR